MLAQHLAFSFLINFDSIFKNINMSNSYVHVSHVDRVEKYVGLALSFLSLWS